MPMRRRRRRAPAPWRRRCARARGAARHRRAPPRGPPRQPRTGKPQHRARRAAPSASLPSATVREAAAARGDRAGLVGWHAGLQMPYAGWSTAIGPGCVVQTTSDRLPLHRERVDAGWVGGAELARGVTTVTTTFAEAPRTRADRARRPGALPATDIGGRQLLLGLDGAARATDAAGNERAPVLLADGQPQRAGLRRRARSAKPTARQAVVVTIASQEGWSLVGVMASAHARMRQVRLRSSPRADSMPRCCRSRHAAPRRRRHRTSSGRGRYGTRNSAGPLASAPPASRRPPHRAPCAWRAARVAGERKAEMPKIGHFVLHSNVLPQVTAGPYELRTEQTGLPFTVATETTHVHVSAPRFTMPTDQILSSFPPANAEGAFGDRLPQIVLKRRTLPWERNPAGAVQPSPTPWLALVVVAEGEARALHRHTGRGVRDGRHDAARPRRQGRRAGALSRGDGNGGEEDLSLRAGPARCSRTCARSISTTPSSPTATTTAGSRWCWPIGCRCSTRRTASRCATWRASSTSKDSSRRCRRR